MRRIYTTGESIYDIIFRNGEPIAANAGGAMLNTSVSLGRLALPVFFISEFAQDDVGKEIDLFLQNNHVDTSYVYRYPDGKTAISLAFLDEKKDASYTFYKNYPRKRFNIEMPEIREGDILLFGGLYSLTPEIREKLISLVKDARDAGAMIIYDPNMRNPHKKQMDALRAFVFENISLAGMVRGSDEDFRTIMDIVDGEKAYSFVCDNGCKKLIYTRSSEQVEVYTPEGRSFSNVSRVSAVSTIGAGDNFNAGLIYELFRSGIDLDQLKLKNLENMVQTAISFGSHVCMHYDNYISKEFAEGIMANG
ncbi:MAG: carbohydrate kinase [Bacteroidales bacterium]|jgi:fructokinase|nr:carbohydrate kinase [Bacteroidales bacterium]